MRCVIQWKLIRLRAILQNSLLNETRKPANNGQQRVREAKRRKESKAFIKFLLKTPVSRKCWKQVKVCKATFDLGQQTHFLKGACTAGKKTCFAITTFSTTPSSLNYYIPKRLPQSPSYWAEPSFIVHGTSWNGAIVGCWVYSHSIPLRGNL